MNEFEEKLNSILSDPAEMERISRLAASLMGGDSGGAAPTQSDDSPGEDSALLNRLGQIFGSAGGKGGDKAALLQALAPFLQPDRQARLQKSLRMAKVLRLAGAALKEYGGGKGV